MELGIYTFGDITADPETGKLITAQQRLKNLIEEIQLAEQVGLDIFAVGEHHRPDYAVSSPAVVLDAAAMVTKKIKLSGAVSVPSSDDPVHVFQDFATPDLFSEGCAEIMGGRGSFIESFPLFGYKLENYDELFTEKLDLLVNLNKSVKVTWKGKHRPSLNNLGVYPRPYQQLYRDILIKSGHDPKKRKLGINSHAYVAETSQRAADEFYPTYAEVMTGDGRRETGDGRRKTGEGRWEMGVTNLYCRLPSPVSRLPIAFHVKPRRFAKAYCRLPSLVSRLPVHAKPQRHIADCRLPSSDCQFTQSRKGILAVCRLPSPVSRSHALFFPHWLGPVFCTLVNTYGGKDNT